MHIMNFIKNYPCTIVTLIVILIGISTIIVTSKVYALTGSEKTSECICLGRNCNYPTSCTNDDSGRKKCQLKVGQRIIVNCQKNVTNFCGNKNTGSRGCCSPQDCNIRCEDFCGDGCITMIITYVDPFCDNAGNCIYQGREIDPLS
ncbi:MAG: hypothetical protein N2169_07650 [bacterium]|nr:hypothetical protein [bacterium]